MKLLKTTSIEPKLGRFDLTMIIVSLVIGVGIFRLPNVVAQKSGTPEVFFSAWVFGGIISICGALTFAEIGSRFPAAGGFYKIFSHCYHPAFAFMLNWVQVIINASSCVGVAIIGAEYINPLIMPEGITEETGIKITVMTILISFYIINLLGIRMGSGTQNVLSMAKIALVAAFCLALFSPPANTEPIIVTSSPVNLSLVQAFGISLISVFFSYGGYQQTMNFGGDVKHPNRNMPLAIFYGIGIVVTLYLCVNYALYHVFGFEYLQQSKVLFADLAGTFLGRAGANFASIAIFISVLGFVNTSIMSNPRMYYAMAEDKVLPEIFQRVNPKTQTQEFSLTIYIAMMIAALFFFGTFEKIVNYVMFSDSIAFAAAAASIFILRRKKENESNAFKNSGFPIIPLLFIVTLLSVSASVMIDDYRASIYGFILFLSGLPIYYLMRRANR